MPRSKTEDPAKLWRFRVFIDGFAVSGFMECTGLKKEVQIVEYSEGGSDTPQKSPGRVTYQNITLSEGQRFAGAGSEDFRTWAEQVHTEGIPGNPGEFRRTLEIVQYDTNGDEAARFEVEQCWPAVYVATGDFSGGSSENSIRRLEIANEGWRQTS